MKENGWIVVQRRPFTMSASERARQLRSLVRLLTDASEVVIEEWEAEERQGGNREHALPSRRLYDARRVIRGACDMCADLVQDPLNRLEEMSHGALSLMESLYILVATGIPDILDETDSGKGVSIQELSHRTRINHQKLGTPFVLGPITYDLIELQHKSTRPPPSLYKSCSTGSQERLFCQQPHEQGPRTQ